MTHSHFGVWRVSRWRYNIKVGAIHVWLLRTKNLGSRWSLLGYVSNFLMLRHPEDCSHIVGVIKAKGWRREEFEMQKNQYIVQIRRATTADRDNREDQSTDRKQPINRYLKSVDHQKIHVLSGSLCGKFGRRSHAFSRAILWTSWPMHDEQSSPTQH